MLRALAIAFACVAMSAALCRVEAQGGTPASKALSADLGVDHSALVAKLQQAYECKEDAAAASTTCTRSEISVVVKGSGRAKAVTFIFPLDNEEQLAGGSVTMVALAKDIFPKWDYAKWYERNLTRAKQTGAKMIRGGVRVSASPFGETKSRLLVVWTTEQAIVQ